MSHREQFLLLLCIIRLLYIYGLDIPGKLTDITKCKLTHLGLDFTGAIAKTDSNVRCQSWTTTLPVHKVDESFTDKNFAEFSMKKAKNYCRNPNKSPEGPWCYTMDPQLIYETCGLPLCSFTECRITGPGMEYGGNRSKAITERKCLKWNKDRHNVKEGKDIKKVEKFHKSRFPDEDLGAAKKTCRNPDGDLAGPWCFVDVEDSDEVIKEYCDIPFCDDQFCMLFSKASDQYVHYTNFNPKLQNISFGIKIWNPDSYSNVSAKLALTLFPYAATGKIIEDLGVGLEILISNKESALTYGNKDTWEYEPTPGILKSNKFTYFSLSWDSGFINLNEEGKVKPIFLAEYKAKNTYMQQRKDSFSFYSVNGNDLLWSFPFCDDQHDCNVHTTHKPFFQQYWPLREQLGRDFNFFVRAKHSAYVLLVASPVLSTPSVHIQLQRDDKFSRIILYEFDKAPAQVLNEVQIDKLISYWQWSEFTISIFGNVMQLHVIKSGIGHLVAEVKHQAFKLFKWFSVASNNALAHWTFFCYPPEESNPKPAWLPECKLSKDEKNYEGTQAITDDGQICLPWGASHAIPHDIAEAFDKKDLYKAWNYCRDPKRQNQGTYCYVYNSDMVVTKRFCNIRKCKSAECKMAGTGNDYVGQLNFTRTNRTCQFWYDDTNDITATFPENHTTASSVKLNKIKRTESVSSKFQLHTVKQEYLNDSLFGDTSKVKAENYCRNPSRDIAGSWCYTLDKNVEFDVCDIKDCDKPEECTIIIRGNGVGKRVYILPQWKERGDHAGLKFSLKQWDPDNSDGFAIEFTPFEIHPRLRLVIGAEKNQKIQLLNYTTVVKQKTLPHLIASGKWTDFWLQIRKGEILLGLQGVPVSLFDYVIDDNSTFEPRFLMFVSVGGGPIGLFLDCNECHTEKLTSKLFSKIYPLSLWQEETKTPGHLSLKIRGTGYVHMPLMLLPGAPEYYQITFSPYGTDVTLLKVTAKESKQLARHEFRQKFFTNMWMNIHINYTEHKLLIIANSTKILEYHSKNPMLFYYFSMGTEQGWVTFSANCNPMDLDGAPLDGGWSQWSDWQCTVSCGGGEGFRTRTCSNPRPNIFGNMCIGSTTTTGLCNDFECGDISPKTMEVIRTHLRRTHYSIVTNESSHVIIKNNQDILKLVAAESPEAYYEWSHNGMILENEPNIIEIKHDNIYIYHADREHAGLYVCMLYRVNKQRMVIQIASLAVTSKDFDIVTRESLDFTLPSHAVLLGFVYSDLRLKWFINSTVYIDHGVTVLAATSSEVVHHINMSQSGVWKCVVTQNDLRFTWITNIVRINVKSRPTFYTHLMEDHLTAPLFAWLKHEHSVKAFVLFIIVLIVVIVIVAVFCYFKFCTLPEQVFATKRNKK